MNTPYRSPLRSPVGPPPVSNFGEQALPFIGRDDEIDELQALIKLNRIVLLHDPGEDLHGFGKSQMAIAYIQRYTRRYDVAWWFSCGQETDGERLQSLIDRETIKLRRACAAAEPTPIPCGDDLETTERWLLVFDGVADPDAIRDYLPQGTGHILVTSRRPGRTWQERSLELAGLDVKEARALLASQLDTLAPDKLLRLAEAMDGHPGRLVEVADLIRYDEVSYRVCVRLLTMLPRREGRAALANGGAPVTSVPPQRGRAGGSPMSDPADRRTFLTALRSSSPGRTRDSYDVWISAIRERIRPRELMHLVDGSELGTRLSALLTEALSWPTPELLQAMVDAAEDQSPADDLRAAQAIVQKVTKRWDTQPGPS